ncbi:hypothetical protein MYSE111917_25000 [Mycobacterium senriense]|uniref:Uncharacterized protein n=1 Tax=Mycobacterium senriense TaxID=2775496 RepID=A0ABM7SPA8_9MYCO|nr:hypothetical protein MTY59_29920 [Mycobacterium senriense]
MSFVAQPGCAKSQTLSSVPTRIGGDAPTRTTVANADTAHPFRDGIAFRATRQASTGGSEGTALPAGAESAAPHPGPNRLRGAVWLRRRGPVPFVASGRPSKLF